MRTTAACGSPIIWGEKSFAAAAYTGQLQSSLTLNRRVEGILHGNGFKRKQRGRRELIGTIIRIILSFVRRCSGKIVSHTNTKK